MPDIRRAASLSALRAVGNDGGPRSPAPERVGVPACRSPGPWESRPVGVPARGLWESRPRGARPWVPRRSGGPGPWGGPACERVRGPGPEVSGGTGLRPVGPGPQRASDPADPGSACGPRPVGLWKPSPWRLRDSWGPRGHGTSGFVELSQLTGESVKSGLENCRRCHPRPLATVLGLICCY